MIELRNPLLIVLTLALVAALSFLALEVSAAEGVRDFFGPIAVPQVLPTQPSSSSSAPVIDVPVGEEQPADDDKAATAEDEEEPINYDDNLLGFTTDFQADLTQPLPQFEDIEKFKSYKAINYDGPGRPTFAAYLSTRNSSIHDPYFYAAQQIAYRLLWDPRSKYVRDEMRTRVWIFLCFFSFRFVPPVVAIRRGADFEPESLTFLVPDHRSTRSPSSWRRSSHRSSVICSRRPALSSTN